MDRMLYIAMNGAKQTMLAQAVNTNNLANVNTTGFRADLERCLSMPVSGPGYASRVYTVTDEPGTDLKAGSVLTTGGELDVAVNGSGWIAVQASDGKEAYTRAGDLHLTATGELQTGAGHPVLGNGGPISLPPATKIQIGSDGTISIQGQGQSPNTLSVVDRIKLVNPPAAQLSKGTDGLMRVSGSAPAPDPNVGLVQGALETSNVNGVESMVNLIALSRNFEMQVKMMKTAEDTEAAGAQVMHFS